MVSIIAIIFITIMIMFTLQHRPPFWVIMVQVACLCMNIPGAIDYLSTL